MGSADLIVLIDDRPSEERAVAKSVLGLFADDAEIVDEKACCMCASGRKLSRRASVAVSFHARPPPLTIKDGVIRVQRTRVSLETIVYASIAVLRLRKSSKATRRSTWRRRTQFLHTSSRTEKRWIDTWSVGPRRQISPGRKSNVDFPQRESRLLLRDVEHQLMRQPALDGRTSTAVAAGDHAVSSACSRLRTS
jgi:hypothetical protein